MPNNMDQYVHRCINDQLTLEEIEKDYEGHIYLWTFAPVYGQRILHGYAMDITRRKKAEELAHHALVEKVTAVEANKAKSQFLATMSHELRTPLNAILGYSDLLKEEAEEFGEERAVPTLSKIHQAGSHLLSLINEILDLSKIEAGKMELFYERFSVENILNEVLATVTPLAKKGGNKIEVIRDDNLGDMHSDITKLRQILLNLLSNACKFTHGGKIQLDVTLEQVQDQHWINFTVTDTGIGMSAEQIHRIFDQFSQADGSTTRKYGGTGLGLTISKHFCEMLGGEIKVTSQVSRGSKFIVRLPVNGPAHNVAA
jgi:signal transduction histidine kinase